jgi:RNA polymerase sigma-70 factor (sigma-E family)
LKAPPDLVSFCSQQQPRLFGMLTLYCGDPDVAEELAQEALARACNRWRQVRRMQAPEAWAYRVAINLANSYFRRKAAERRAQQRLRGQRQADHHDPDSASSVAVFHAVAKLPRRQRAALVLRYYADLSVGEVAQLMDCPEGTVKTLTRKAVATLRDGFGRDDLQEVSHVT